MGKSLPKKKSSDNNFKQEELRGLFVLGLLAVLASIRLQNVEMMIFIGHTSFDLVPLLDMTIVSWSFYAFFMVVGLSEDVFPETISNVFRELSKMFLMLDFILLGFFSLAIFYWAFPTRWVWTLILTSILVSYIAYKKLTKRRKRKIGFNFTEFIKTNVSSSITQSLIVVIGFLFFLVIFIKDERLVLPLFLSDCIVIVVFITIRQLLERTN